MRVIHRQNKFRKSFKPKKMGVQMELTGQIERITYNNEENGFTIAQVKVKGQHDLVTVLGNIMAPLPGEVLEMHGEWTQHPRYGEQFKIAKYKTKVPATVYGIRKYLGSGLIKGLGPVMAERIVAKFGKKTLDIIEADIGRLSEIEGIGEKRLEMIQEAWEDQREIRDVMIFLQSYGVSSGYATKIFKQYGNGSITVVKQNPYRLADDIFGIGFLTADKIAAKLGFPKNSELRVQAGILYVLNQLAEDGHVLYPYEPLIEKCREILEVDREIVLLAIEQIARDKKIVIEKLEGDHKAFADNDKGVYLTRFYTSETGVTNRLRMLTQVPKAAHSIETDKALSWVQQRLAIRLAKNQMEAIRWAVEKKILIITGGPGTGKTTIINAIIKIMARTGVKILLGAPTGRAAKRMNEATGHVAKTIHRLLEFSFKKGGFQRSEEKPLNCDLLIIDETSMIDTILMYHLLKAVPVTSTLILVGDANQLPSVGAGNVLKDIIASKAVQAIELNKIFRQARESQIIVNAHLINDGIIPSSKTADHPEEGTTPKDFYFIQQEDPQQVLEIIIELTKERIPRRFGFNPVDDIQVLTPMYKGVVGAENLNRKLQDILNPRQDGVQRGDRFYRIHDKVMQIRNNYDKEVFNGDIGKILRIDSEAQEVEISYDGRRVAYGFGELDEVVLAYAVSVHKSQGSEYPAVVIPIVTQHYILLQRNLIYTAVTRGKKLVVMVGTRKALAIGVKNDKTQKRYTYLKERLSS